ncbi:MAG: amino acid ABC transporter substrate-binding protein [Pseudomonadota bacterium]
MTPTRLVFQTLAACAAVLVGTAIAPGDAYSGERMEQIIADKRLKLGYRSDAAPFSSESDGRAGGFSVELCVEIGKRMKDQLGLSDFSASLVKVDTTDRFDAIARGDADLLCGATTATLSRREMVSFSVPTFVTGVSAVVGKDAPDLLKEILIENSPAAFSSAATAEAIKGRKLGVRAGTTASEWLNAAGIARSAGEPLTEISDHADGIAAVVDGRLDAYFADKAILAATVGRTGNKDKVVISGKAFTNEPYAIAIPRGDEDLRLEVDRALSDIYRSGKIIEILTRYFGAPTVEIALFYSFATIPR